MGEAIIDALALKLDPIFSGDALDSDVYPFVYDFNTMAIPTPDNVYLEYDHQYIIGIMNNIEVVNGVLKGSGSILSYSESDLSADLIRRIRDGLRFGISPTIYTHHAEIRTIGEGEQEEVNGRIVNGPCEIICNTELGGISLTPYPTDPNTGIDLYKKTLDFLSSHKIFKNGVKKMADEEIKKDDPEQCSDDGAGEGEVGAVKYPKYPETQPFIDAFGPERGIEYFLEGKTLEEAERDDYEQLKAAKLSEEEKKTDELSEGEEETPKEEEPEKPNDETDKLNRKIIKLSNTIEELSKNVKSMESRLKKFSLAGGEPIPSRSASSSVPRFGNALTERSAEYMQRQINRLNR